MDLFFSLSFFFLQYATCLGWGILASKALGLVLPDEEKPFSMFWLGWSLLLFMLHLYHLFLPITAMVSIFFAVVGLTSSWKYARGYFSPMNSESKSLALIFGILLLLFAVLVASRSMKVPVMVDSAMYHFNSVRWMNEYSIIPGLGNLHSRLAFNNYFFGYVACLNIFPLFNHGHNIANSFFLVIVFAECLYYLTRYIAHLRLPQNSFLISKYVPIFFLPLLPTLGTSGFKSPPSYDTLSSPAPDILTFLILIVIFFHFIRAFDEFRLKTLSSSRLRFILLFAATLITVKLNSLIYVSVISCICCWWYLRVRQQSIREKLRYLCLYMLLPFSILLLFAGRGVILSGCPVFPSSALCVDTDWAMSIEGDGPDGHYGVSNTKSWIFSWARQPFKYPTEVLSNWDWVQPWLKDIKKRTIAVVYPLLITGLLIVISFFLFWYSILRKKRKPSLDPVLVLLPVPAGLIFWFFTAPDIRFASAMFFILPVTVVIPLVTWIDHTTVSTRKWSLIILFFLLNFQLGSYLIETPSLFAISTKSGYGTIPFLGLKERELLSGQTVFLPEAPGQLWDSPLPATLSIDPLLRCRGEELQQGFTVSKCE